MVFIAENRGCKVKTRVKINGCKVKTRVKIIAEVPDFKIGKIGHQA